MEDGIRNMRASEGRGWRLKECGRGRSLGTCSFRVSLMAECSISRTRLRAESKLFVLEKKLNLSTKTVNEICATWLCQIRF